MVKCTNSVITYLMPLLMNECVGVQGRTAMSGDASYTTSQTDDMVAIHSSDAVDVRVRGACPLS